MNEATTDKTAVLLDEHPLWVNAVAQVLERAGIQLLGSATDPVAALDLVASLKPDVFVMTLEVRAQGVDGFECLRRTKSLSPATQIVVVSAEDDPRLIEAAFAEGATSFCKKSAEPDELAVAIRQAFARSIYLNGASGHHPSGAQGVGNGGPDLTRREFEILRLVSEGDSNAQVARKLWVTEQTVKFHLSNIYRKLQVANRTEASRWAQLHGLLARDQSRRGSISAY